MDKWRVFSIVSFGITMVFGITAFIFFVVATKGRILNKLPLEDPMLTKAFVLFVIGGFFLVISVILATISDFLD